MQKCQIPPHIKDAVEGLVKPYGVTFSLVPVDNPPSRQSFDKKYFDVPGAVAYTSLSRWSLARAVKEGRLTCIKMSPSKTGKVLFPRETLDTFLKSLTFKPRSVK